MGGVWNRSHSHPFVHKALLISAGIRFGNRGEKSLRVFVLRRFDDRIAITLFDDLAIEHYRDAVADVMNHGHVMRDEKIGESEIILQIGEQIQNLRLDRDVERGGRFVTDDQSRLESKCPCDPDALSLATRELVWVSVGGLAPETAPLEEILDALPEFVTTGEAMNLEWLADDTTDAHAGIQGTCGILEDDLHLATDVPHLGGIHVEHVLALVLHDPGGRGDEAENRSTDGGLAAARLTHQTEGLAGIDLEVHAIDCANMIHHSLEDSPSNRKMSLEVLDFEQGTC